MVKYSKLSVSAEVINLAQDIGILFKDIHA